MQVKVSSYAHWSSRAALRHESGIEPYRITLKNGDSLLIAPAVSEHKDTTILPGDWLPVENDGLTTFEWMVHTPSQFPGKSRSIRVDGGHFLSSATQLSTSLNALALIGGSVNYYHWLVDYLPRLLVLEGLEAFDDWPVVLNQDLARHQLESLCALEIPNERLVLARPDEAINAPRVVVPTLLSTTTLCHPAVPRMLNAAFGSAVARPRRRIYLARDDAASRRFINEPEVLQVLSHYGFEKRIAGPMTFMEQVELFNEAQAIVAAHGAGMTNMIFSKPGAFVFEIASPAWQVTSMRFLAHLCRHRHEFVDAQALGPHPNPLLNDWVVDIAQLAARLKHAFGA